MKKKAKAKRLPKPVPCECWCILTDDGRILPGWCGDRERIRDWKAYWRGGWGTWPMKTIRVRITPVAKRRKGAK